MKNEIHFQNLKAHTKLKEIPSKTTLLNFVVVEIFFLV